MTACVTTRFDPARHDRPLILDVLVVTDDALAQSKGDRHRLLWAGLPARDGATGAGKGSRSGLDSQKRWCFVELASATATQSAGARTICMRNLSYEKQAEALGYRDWSLRPGGIGRHPHASRR